MRRSRLAMGIAGLFAVLALLVTFRAPLGRALLAGAVDAATGYQVAFDGVALRTNRAVFSGLHVRRAGEPLLDVRRLEVRYALRELLFGGARRYGLIAVDVEAPALTLVRHADGSFNAGAIGGGSGGAPEPPAGHVAPLEFSLRVRQGSIAVVDPNRSLANARRLTLGALAVDGTIDTAARSQVRARAAFGAAREPIAAAFGRDAAGDMLARVRASHLDLTDFVDYFVNSDSARFERALTRNLEVRWYAFAGHGTSAPYHVTGSADLVDGAMRVPGIVPSALAMHGRIDLYDGGIATPHLEAELGRIGVRLTGGLYDWDAPAFRLAIVAPVAPLPALRSLFRFSRDLPLRGAASVSTLLEGPVGTPLVVSTVAAPAFAYAGFPVERAQGRVFYYGDAVDVVGARAEYGGLTVRANGHVDLGDVAHTQLVVGADGPADRVPYAAQIAPAARLQAAALLAGDDLRFDARGYARGSGGGVALAALFHVDPNGDGAFAPLWARRAGPGEADQTLAGGFYLERSRSLSAFWLDARNYPFALAPSDPHLPGIALAPPGFSGTFNGALAGIGPPSGFALGGLVAARGARAGTIAFDALRGHVTGTLAHLRLNGITAGGPWGRFAGAGGYDGGRLALVGRYRGSFAELRGLTGELGGAGPVDGPVALLFGAGATVVQARDDTTAGATVRGVPVERLAGTLTIGPGGLTVDAATARVAGGSFVAAGALEGAQGIGVSVSEADARGFHTFVPLDRGSVAAIGTLGAAAARGPLRLQVGLSLARGSALGVPLGGDGDLTLAGSELTVGSADATADGAVGRLDGRVGSLGSAAARYDVRLRLSLAPLGPLAAALLPGRRYVAGTLGADLHLGGTGRAPELAGTIEIPEASVNGLNFGAARAWVAVDRQGFALRRGQVTVGSTRAGFSAAVRGDDTALSLAAPAADLADFNDYFDAGDTLGGHGRIVAGFERHAGRIATNADIAIAGLRYRRFDLGDAGAHWTSNGPRVNGAVAFGGASGQLDTQGSVLLNGRDSLDRIFARAVFRGKARLRGLDLGVWLPALGYQVPVTGRVDADADVTGPLGNPLVTTNASLGDGTLGPFPVERFVVQASSNIRRTTVASAELDLPSLSLTGSGSFGLGAGDPLAFGIHATTPNVGDVVAPLLGAGYSRAARAGPGGARSPAPPLVLRGAGEADLKIAGTRGRPRVEGGFDLNDAALRGVAIPRVLGQFNLNGRDVVLSGIEVGFATGTLYAAGSVPLVVAPLGFGPASAPITLDLTAAGIDLADFTGLLPAGSQLAGRLDGRVAVGGSAGSPELNGALTLAAGRLRTPLETVPLTNLRGRVSFRGNEARLESLQAAAGGGTLEVSGRQSFADLVHPELDADYGYVAKAAHLRLELPAYGSGTLDGTLSLAHPAGSAPHVAGDIAFSDGAIPFSALLLVAAPAAANPGDGFAAALPAPQVPSAATFDLTIEAQRNVRIRSANVDIGARGSLHVSGSRAAPVLSGTFDSTGGTLTYFNTVFRLLDGRLTFEPDLGLIPTLDAHAITHVLNPDPNVVRNPGGSADITLGLQGPVTNLTIGLDSSPAYDRQQILGLLVNAPALGATNLFGETQQTPTLYGSNDTHDLPAGIVAARSPSGQLSVAQEAFGVANAQFTRALLSPIETSFAQAVGLSNVNVNVDYTGNVGFTARKILGKNVNAIYGTSFGYPSRQTFGFEIKPSPVTVAQVTVFETVGALGLNSLTPAYATNNPRLQAAQPTTGSVGFSLSFQRLFK